MSRPSRRAGWLGLAALLAGATGHRATAADAEARLLELLAENVPFARVPAAVFDGLGSELPDAGQHVRRIADAAPGGALDPRALEKLDPAAVGYRAEWHTLRYRHYDLDWDVTGLLLSPARPEPGLPTLVLIHGGSANWYEFFVDPLNQPGLGQYLAQRARVLLVTIPGNYKPGGWLEENRRRRPAYLLDREPDDAELRVRNAVFTFQLVCEGVARLVEAATRGPLLIVGHSTGGEIQFLLKERLASRLLGRSLGWGTGGPAALRRDWEEEAADADDRARERRYPPVTELRGRGIEEYTRGYVGPLNPLGPGSERVVAERWFAREGRRRPHFKQPLQDLEHTGRADRLAEIEKEIRAALDGRASGPDPGAVVRDLFSTMRSTLGGYRRMVFTTAARDTGHWAADPKQARELWVADAFRRANPDAAVRVLVYDLPLTHYGHIERPRSLAGGLLVAARWLVAVD